MCALRCCPVDTPPALPDFRPAGDDVYLVGPPTSKAGVLLISDMFGMHRASKQLADVLARAGFLVVMPDFFDGQAWPEDKFPPDFASDEWAAFYVVLKDTPRHRPRAERAVALLRALGCTHVGAIGMCWGAVLSLDLSAHGVIDAAAAAHPSFLEPALVQAARTPVCVLPSVDEVNYDAVEAAVHAHAQQPSVYKKYDKLHYGFVGARLDRAKLDDAERAQLDDALAIIVDFFTRALHKSA